jgi:hypothetical protein
LTPGTSIGGIQYHSAAAGVTAAPDSCNGVGVGLACSRGSWQLLQQQQQQQQQADAHSTPPAVIAAVLSFLS